MSDVNKQLLAMLAQLELAETEMNNAKAWSAGDQAKTHCNFALTAIATARHVIAIAAAEQAKTVTLEQLVANLKAGEGGDAIGAAMDQACADMELGRRIREQAQQAEPRCACGDSFTSDAVCANCLAAQLPAVAVPDGYVLTKIPHEYAKTLVNGGWNQYADGWNACRAAMLAAAQKGGA